MAKIYASIAHKKASDSFRAQKERCNRKESPKYKYYGAKGARVEYSRLEFIKWYVEKFNSKKWKDPTVGRIDHSKNYSFDNIEMQERSENTLEMIKRNPSKGRKFPLACKKVLLIKEGIPFLSFFSVNDAAAFLKVKPPAVSCVLMGYNQKTKSGYILKYIGEGKTA